MGGRGSVSISSGGNINIGELNGGANDIHNVGGKSDARAAIMTMFVDELGFTDVSGLNMIDTGVLGAYGVRLNQLERKYHAIDNSENPSVAGMNSSHVIGAVEYFHDSDPANGQRLLINRYLMSSIHMNVSRQKEAEAQNWKMTTDGKVTSQATYTITHEYGHMLMNAMYSRAVKSGSFSGTLGQYEHEAAKQIVSIARNKYHGTQDSISKYGAYNSGEFFAEAFAGANTGGQSAVSKAFRDWEKTNVPFL